MANIYEHITQGVRQHKRTKEDGVLQRYGRAAGDSKDRRECKQKKKLYVDNNECVFIGYHYGCIMLFVPKLL